MSNVIELSTRIASRPAAARPATPHLLYYADGEQPAVQRRRQQEPQAETAKNAKLRQQRRDAWRAAEARTAYGHARMKLHRAISGAQTWRAFPEGLLGEIHPEYDSDEWMLLVRSYRSALAKQFLTPAHGAADVEWKRKALAAENLTFIELTRERIEFAIAQDVEFLTSHPMRRRADRERRPQQ